MLERFLDAQEVEEMIDIGVGVLSGWVKAGKFPMPVKVSRGRSETGRNKTRSYWKKSDVDAWLEIQQMKQEATARYNAELNARMLAEMKASVKAFDKPVGLRNNTIDEAIRQASKPSPSTKRK